MKLKACLLNLVLSIGLLSCNSAIDAPDEYILTSSELKNLYKQKDHTYLLFWTDWCGGSKLTIENYYTAIKDSIQSRNLNSQIVLIAADETISLDAVKSKREEGFLSYYMDSPGGNALSNRIAVCNYIDEVFPNQEVSYLDWVAESMPTRILINKHGEILNPTLQKDIDTFIEAEIYN